MLHITLEASHMKAMGPAFDALSKKGLDLTFLAASRLRNETALVDLCLPLTKKGSNRRSIKQALKRSHIKTDVPVGTFSMNGPHFGDRYGIASDLLSALETAGIDLLGLSCTIASITGVVPSSQLSRTIDAIRDCFDVPSLVKKDPEYE